MKRSRPDSLLTHVQNFFEGHLRQVLGVSQHTIKAYRDSLRLFFLFLAKRKKCTIADLRLEDLQSEKVLAFLLHIESERKNQPATRNLRLVAIRSFAMHLLSHDLTHAAQYRRILSIPTKRAVRHPASYLEPEEVKEIIKQIPEKGFNNVRDRALLLFLYNTGARISEALEIRSHDIHLDRPRQVRIMGKGKRERICPLWAETATSLRRLIGFSDSLGQPIFTNRRKEKISRDGAAYILAKYARRAAEAMPSLRSKRITPHTLRHSCAIALLQSGVDLTVIRDYLGHASISTTGHYVTSNLQMKRKVLQAFWKRAGLDSRASSKWNPSPDLLAFLESL
jgi:integrase/recombinase XerD